MQNVLFSALGFPAATFARVIVEGTLNPGTHNLWPLALIISFFIGLVGAWVGGSIQQIDSESNVFNIKYSAYENKKLQQWIKDAGIKKHITFHCARHTFATLALTNGADLYVIQKLLGHSEIKTTAIYTKIIDEKKSEAVNCLPQINIF